MSPPERAQSPEPAAPDALPAEAQAALSAGAEHDEPSWDRQIGQQFAALPPALRKFDIAIVKLTEWSVVAVGVLFTAMITLEVVSRYLFGFSIVFVNAASKFLLLWFFLLGAGLALRNGAHVGFELLLHALPAGGRRAVEWFARILAIFFFGQMLWGGLIALGPATAQTDPGLGASLLWAFLAIPIGFGLLIYHMVILLVLDAGKARMKGLRA